ncbi:MAG: hypothetical protein J3Q66DRAFT_367402 [Benniella sp.]|nr:MAG: hypothetical protein J3Q66DRAFT_367402 [Benniella sp.]
MGQHESLSLPAEHSCSCWDCIDTVKKKERKPFVSKDTHVEFSSNDQPHESRQGSCDRLLEARPAYTMRSRQWREKERTWSVFCDEQRVDRGHSSAGVYLTYAAYTNHISNQFLFTRLLLSTSFYQLSPLISMAEITLFCTIEGARSTFLVDIGLDKRVGHLQMAIKLANPNDFRGVDADKLTLYKVEIPSTSFYDASERNECEVC